MSFDRPSTMPRNMPHQINSIQTLATMPKKPTSIFNSPMIERIHKSKPGCSACGKKVM